MLKPVRTAAPSEEFITLGEAKAQLRVDHTDEDTLIAQLVSTAVAHLDGYAGILGRAIVTQSWKIELEDFDDDEIRLPIGDLISVTSVKYYSAANSQQTLATTVYGAYTDDRGPFIELKTGQTWPAVYDREDAVEIIWQAGYGAATAVPVAIKQAGLLMIGHWYAKRAAVGEGTFMEIPLGAQALLAPYRMNPL